MRECWEVWYGTFPDFTYRVDRVVSQGTTVMAEIIGRGAHQGEVFGLSATNKRVEAQEIWVFDFEAGKVKLWKEYYSIPGFAGAQLEQFLRG